MRYFKFTALALLSCAAGLCLTGCGGGGGDGVTPAIRFAAEGFWGGPDIASDTVGPPLAWNGATGHFWGDPTSGSDHMGMVVLADGDTWAVDTVHDVAIGAFHGKTTTGGTGVNMIGTWFDVGSVQGNVAFTGAVTPRSRLDVCWAGNTGGDGCNVSHFVGAYDASYDQQATLTRIARSYTGTGGTTRGNNPGTGYTITIDAAGKVTLPPDAVGCSASGTVSPMGDKDVFRLGNLVFSGANCALGNGTAVNGIAVVANDGHLLMMGATVNDADGFIYVSN